MRCRGLHSHVDLPYSSGFLFSGLPCVAPYCVPGGVRVVSTEVELGARSVLASVYDMISRLRQVEKRGEGEI
jgi:hypothetical protein